MAKISYNRQRKFDQNYNTSLAATQVAMKVEILNAAGTTQLFQDFYPLGSDDYDFDIAAGTYVFRITVLDTITAGNMMFQLVDEVPAVSLFSTGSVINEGNKVYTSPVVSISSNFNNLKIYQSNSFQSQAPVAAFGVSAGLGACYGVVPNKERRVSFVFENYQAPMQFSTDNIDFVTFNPGGFYRQAPIGDVITYYFKDATGATDSVEVTFTDCAVPAPAAPTLSSYGVLITDTVDIIFADTPAKIRVYQGTSVVRVITNAASPYTYQPVNLATGEFKFSIETAAGESAKSAVLVVNSATGESFCNFPHLADVATWNEATGPYQWSAIKFSNSGQKAWLGQIVSLVPLKFLIRGKSAILRDDVSLAAGVSTLSVDCLAGVNTGLGGLLEPAGFPLPPGYEKTADGVYQPAGTGGGESVTERVKVTVTEYCTATTSTVQVGVTENYTSGQPVASEVVRWVDGLEADVVTRGGVYPWLFIRDKNNPTNISAPFNILES